MRRSRLLPNSTSDSCIIQAADTKHGSDLFEQGYVSNARGVKAQLLDKDVLTMLQQLEIVPSFAAVNYSGVSDKQLRLRNPV